MSTVAVLALGALCGGFVSGLAGFGTALTTLGLWLHVVSPPVAAALMVVCSVVGQVQSRSRMRGGGRQTDAPVGELRPARHAERDAQPLDAAAGRLTGARGRRAW